MEYIIYFSLAVFAYCMITSEVKKRKRDKRHKRAEVIEFI